MPNHFNDQHACMKFLASILITFFCLLMACRADDSQQLSAQGMSAFRQNNYTQAINYFDQAIEANTNYVGAYYYRGLSYMGETQYDSSIADLSHAISLNTNEPDAYYFRAMCFFHKKIITSPLPTLTQ